MLSRFFLCPQTSLLAAYAPSGLVSSCPRLVALSACTLVLVCPSCGCLPGPPNEMKHTLKTATPDAWKDNSHTRVHQGDISQSKREPRSFAHTPKHCAVLQQLIGNRTMDRTYVGMALIRLLQTLPRLPLRPNYSVGKTRRTGLQLIAD
jgi:hypothetical protein